jgi:hypothetical protein
LKKIDLIKEQGKKDRGKGNSRGLKVGNHIKALMCLGLKKLM